jgi:hypothetical protein
MESGNNLFVEEINEIAKENKIKVTHVAKYLGCSRVTFYSWLKGVAPQPVFDKRVRELHNMLTTTNNPKAAFYTEYK